MSNGALTQNLEHQLYEAPLILHALLIAGNTAMMCQQPEAKRMIDALKAKLRATIPVEAFHFDEEDFATFGKALQEPVTYHVFYHRSNRFSRIGYIHVRIGDREWKSRSYNTHEKDAETVEKVGLMLEKIAHMDAVRLGVPDDKLEEQKSW
ncbi:hypothetical protein BAJUN_00650 [Bajunvirus bajun]|uniref:Uncharacterized protein n=1 Tax=Brevundimonas phage vB_BgoS-Bajun TaxID=2948594 RepID=A0A9E7N656_9CAUD|nr:hypothetical protein BAJUN_00650 [Brevundimonas phage vB_BgoS-Bajun]